MLSFVNYPDLLYKFEVITVLLKLILRDYYFGDEFGDESPEPRHRLLLYACDCVRVCAFVCVRVCACVHHTRTVPVAQYVLDLGWGVVWCTKSGGLGVLVPKRCGLLGVECVLCVSMRAYVSLCVCVCVCVCVSVVRVCMFVRVGPLDYVPDPPPAPPGRAAP